MLELVSAIGTVLAFSSTYRAATRVVCAFLFLILLRVTVPRMKVEGVSKYGWVVGWVLSAVTVALAACVWCCF